MVDCIRTGYLLTFLHSTGRSTWRSSKTMYLLQNVFEHLTFITWWSLGHSNQWTIHRWSLDTIEDDLPFSSSTCEKRTMGNDRFPHAHQTMLTVLISSHSPLRRRCPTPAVPNDWLSKESSPENDRSSDVCHWRSRRATSRLTTYHLGSSGAQLWGPNNEAFQEWPQNLVHLDPVALKCRNHRVWFVHRRSSRDFLVSHLDGRFPAFPDRSDRWAPVEREENKSAFPSSPE